MASKAPLSWKTSLMEELREATKDDSFWAPRVNDSANSVHLSIFNPPYLDYLLEGKKTVESRFSSVRCAPYGQVTSKDILLLKEASGPIVGLCLVDYVWSYELDPSSWDEIRTTFSKMLCAEDPEFWSSRSNASYATLMRVVNPTRIDHIECKKTDRRGWVVLRCSRNLEFIFS